MDLNFYMFTGAYGFKRLSEKKSFTLLDVLRARHFQEQVNGLISFSW